MTLHKLFIVTYLTQSCIQVTNDAGRTDDLWLKNSFKLVKTKPGTEGKVGDTVIRIKGGTSTCPTGTVFTVLKSDRVSLFYTSSLSVDMNECKVLCKAELKFKNPFKKGDKVISLTNDGYKREAGSEHTVYKVSEDQVHYEEDFATHYKNFKLSEQKSEPRVAIVTQNVYGHPVGSRIVPINAENSLWKLINDPSSEVKAHILGHNCKWEDINVLKHCKNICHESQVSPAIIGSQQMQSISEEKAMNTNENITIAMTADEYAKYQKQNKPTRTKTDLEQAPEWLTIWYDAYEMKLHQTTQSPKQARKALQKPDSLGHTFRSYLITKSATTDVPVVDLKV